MEREDRGMSPYLFWSGVVILLTNVIYFSYIWSKWNETEKFDAQVQRKIQPTDDAHRQEERRKEKPEG